MRLIWAALMFGMCGEAGCTTSGYKQVAGEVPQYGLSTVRTPTGPCYIYVERDNGASLFCFRSGGDR